ncbi:MAG TPA: MFS transporter, partial [Alphaproteobacteria bacterium]|nr:MFS transporter [Alphaproteobacteria bacterium]
MTDRIHRFAIAATFFVNGILFASWVTRIPDVKQGLGLDEASLGTALLAIAVGGLIAMPLAGGQAARRGSRFATIATALLSLLVVPLPVLAVGQMTLAGALLLFGACLSSLSVAMNAQAAVLEARMRRPIMSSFHGAFSLGGLVGAGIGGLIAQAGVAPLPHLLGASAFGAAVLAFALPRLLRDGPAPAA